MAGVNIFRLFGEIGLNGTQEVENDLQNVSQAGQETERNLNKSFNEMSTKAGELGNKMAIGLGAITTGLIAGTEATREYRQDLGRLVSGYEGVGLSTETAMGVYKEFYGLLGESDTAIEASNLLKELAQDEQGLAEWTNIAAGVYARFPDSIPIEAMIESANETAKVGQITGNLADALNWAGVSEDEFNLKLAETNTEAEREALIRDTLNGLYTDSANKYKENNKDVIEANKAQAELTDNLAKTTGKLEPLITKGKLFLAEVLQKAEPLITWLINNAPLVGTLITGVVGTIFALSIPAKILALKTSIMGLNATMAANPIGMIILAVGALITILVLLIQNWDTVKEVAGQVWDYIVQIWQVAATWFDENVIQPIANFFSQLWTGITEGVTNAWDFIVGIFSIAAQWVYDNVIQPIINFFTPFIDFLKNAILVYITLVSMVLETLYNIVKSVIDKILAVVGAISSWINTNVLQPIINFFSNAFNTIFNFVSGIIEKIKSIFGTVSTFVKDKVLTPITSFFKSTFDTAWNIVSNVIDKIKNGFQKISDFVKTIFGNVKTSISTSFSTVSGVIKTPINGVIRLINKALQGLNKIKVPDWVPNIGGKGVNFKMIPELAEGGVLEKGQTGFLEGNGAEAVVPLHNNKKWISAVADDMQGAFYYTELYKKFDRVINLLTSYLPQLSQMQLVTDTGALVGELVSPMDKALGELSIRKGRGR